MAKQNCKLEKTFLETDQEAEVQLDWRLSRVTN